jgi:prevent-host-death family protein
VAATDGTANVLTVTEAASMGVPRLLRDAEAGTDIIVSRRNRPIAAVVSMERLAELRRLESDLRDLTLILARAATDDGSRTSLDDAITAFGFDRQTLEAELDADLAAGRG